MEPKIVKAKSLNEHFTPERCFIAENYSTKKVSVARARVKAGVTTVAHHLRDVDEIYLVTSGKGKVIVGNLPSADVEAGDVIVIPAGTSQKITNTGRTDLVFYCICTPRFTEDCYCDEEAEKL
ncbi:MAG: cupin domain-containing protein [Candidatus Bathyarchaeota archaeon]|jgi:mannose-6-phosphate isomerase-like protein (cupin superfamily)|nr:cupin domain-containing protein [Candidatus Bathyarchaeota archaeon]